VRRLLSKMFGRLRFEDLNIPLHVIATDLQSGEPVMLDEGSLVEAIRASIAIPVLFQPYRVNGRYLVDGALTAPLPIEHAIAAGAEVIISMGFPSQLHRKIDGPLRLVTQIMRISGNRLYRAELAYARSMWRWCRSRSCATRASACVIRTRSGLIELAKRRWRACHIRRTIEFHSTRNRTKQRLRLSARRALRVDLDLPEYGT
jgi:predicted acylesterase/phospholipase RssA